MASRSQWEGVAWSSVWIWLLIAVATGLAAPDLAQHALLRRFGARSRRVNWIERRNRLVDGAGSRFQEAQFIVSYGVPVVIPSAVLLAYVFRFPTAAPVLGLVLPFYLGNIWFTLLVLRRPAGTLVQTLERSLRLHVPTLQASSA